MSNSDTPPLDESLDEILQEFGSHVFAEAQKHSGWSQDEAHRRLKLLVLEGRLYELETARIERFLINCNCEAHIMHVPHDHKNIQTREDRIKALEEEMKRLQPQEHES